MGHRTAEELRAQATELQDAWELLKSKLEDTRKDALTGKIGAKEDEDVNFLQGMLLGLEGIIHLMKLIEDQRKSEEKSE
jgi:hypothetical protein